VIPSQHAHNTYFDRVEVTTFSKKNGSTTTFLPSLDYTVSFVDICLHACLTSLYWLFLFSPDIVEFLRLVFASYDRVPSYFLERKGRMCKVSLPYKFSLFRACSFQYVYFLYHTNLTYRISHIR